MRFIVLIVISIVFYACSDLSAPTSIVSDIDVENTEIYGGVVYYNNAPYSGTRIKKYDNGKSYWKVDLIEGRRNGHYEEWFKSGALRVLENYVSNKRHGRSETFWNISDENINPIRAKGDYVHGLKEGEWHFFYANGQLHYKDRFKKDRRILEGSYTFYFPNGGLKNVISYLNGKPHGKWVYYHENGKIKSELDYKEGEEHGLFQIWYDNGQLMRKENFINGKRKGLMELFDRNGQLRQQKTYL